MSNNSMSHNIVVTEGLTKRYGDRAAVDRVALHVGAGEVYGVLGPNGAGKTTTLRMLAGLIRPSAGTATVFGRAPATPEIAARIGVLIEDPGFYPYLSGRDNLRVHARYRDVSDRDVDAALDRVGLLDRGGDRFRGYSLGMKQRLGVGCTLLGDSDLLILDEPTNGLDPAGVAEMRRLVADLAAEGRTILLSSHQLGEVQEICDRVGVISAGRLLAESTVAQLRGASTLYLRADPVDVALAAVARITDRSTERVGDGIRVDLAADRAPELARAVVHAGADLLELRTDEKSLAEVYFEMTEPKEAR